MSGGFINKKWKRCLWLLLILSAVTVTAAFLTRDKPEKPPYPPVTRNGERWRIAYYEGGEYIDYASNLRAIATALEAMDWIEPINIPDFDNEEDTSKIWQYLARNVTSEYISFAADAFYSAGWDEAARDSISGSIINRLNTAADIDLLIAMGTWAGQDMVNDLHSTATLALSSSDPVAAGIIDTYRSSGYEHVLVEVDPERYRRQIRLFHEIVGFERLGVVSEDSNDGRIYSNLADLEYVAKEKNFTIVECHTDDYPNDEERSHQGVVGCYSALAPQIDALWIGAHNGEDPQHMPESLDAMFENNIPTYASVGPSAVKRGVLLSIQYTDSDAAGLWYVGVMARIFHGETPGSINQVFEMPGQISINLETARRINFQIPEGVLAIADEVYTSIGGK